MSLFFDPYSQFPYYLRILSPVKDHDIIRNYRIKILKSIGYWNPDDPKVYSLIEPLHYGIYTELVHRTHGVAGFVEIIDYADQQLFNPNFIISQYYQPYLKKKVPDLNNHVRSMYLLPEFRKNGTAFLYLCYLNCHYMHLHGAESASFSTNPEEKELIEMYLKMGAEEFVEVNRITVEKHKQWLGHFSLSKVLMPLKMAIFRMENHEKSRAQFN